MKILKEKGQVFFRGGANREKTVSKTVKTPLTFGHQHTNFGVIKKCHELLFNIRLCNRKRHHHPPRNRDLIPGVAGQVQQGNCLLPAHQPANGAKAHQEHLPQTGCAQQDRSFEQNPLVNCLSLQQPKLTAATNCRKRARPSSGQFPQTLPSLFFPKGFFHINRFICRNTCGNVGRFKALYRFFVLNDGEIIYLAVAAMPAQWLHRRF